MGIKRAWKFQKLSTLPIPVELREDIIGRIIRRKGNQPITLYAWQVQERTAVEAFPTKHAALGAWAQHVGAKLLAEGKEFPSQIRVVKWPMEINEMIGHIKDGKLPNIEIPANQWEVLDLPLPPALFEDISSIAAKAGVKRP